MFSSFNIDLGVVRWPPAHRAVMRDARPTLFICAVLCAVLRSGFRDTAVRLSKYCRSPRLQCSTWPSCVVAQKCINFSDFIPVQRSSCFCCCFCCFYQHKQTAKFKYKIVPSGPQVICRIITYHMEKTEAGLKGLCIREIMTEYTLYYTKYYTIILRFPMLWRSPL